MNLIPENKEFEEFLNSCKVSQEDTDGAFESLDPEYTDYSEIMMKKETLNSILVILKIL